MATIFISMHIEHTNTGISLYYYAECHHMIVKYKYQQNDTDIDHTKILHHDYKP